MRNFAFKLSLMESWQLEFEWLRVRHFVKDNLGRKELPDLNGVLFLIGIQELGYWQEEFTKEQKQDLMHIAICKLLSYDNYYEFEGRDQDGWPHYKMIKPYDMKGAEGQEQFLIERVISYFDELESETGHVLNINDN